MFSCLKGDVLFAWTAAYPTCLMWACVPRLLSGLYQLFDLCLIKHVLTVWPLTSTLACLVTKQCLMVFGRQTFLVCPGPKASANEKCLMTKQHRTGLATEHFTIWPPCLVLFDRVWSYLAKFEDYQTFDQKRKTFLLFSCLMGDVLFLWTAAYQTCLMRACSAACINCLICVWSIMFWPFGHSLQHQRVWSPNNVWWWLVAKQCLMMFGRQTFPVCTGLWVTYIRLKDRDKNVLLITALKRLVFR